MQDLGVGVEKKTRRDTDLRRGGETVVRGDSQNFSPAGCRFTETELRPTVVRCREERERKANDVVLVHARFR